MRGRPRGQGGREEGETRREAREEAREEAQKAQNYSYGDGAGKTPPQQQQQQQQQQHHHQPPPMPACAAAGAVAASPLLPPPSPSPPSPSPLPPPSPLSEETPASPFYDQLQTERASWSAERRQLLSVISVQQAELSLQTSSGRDRAVSVATTFSSAVEVFERRLVSVERNVASELKRLSAGGVGRDGAGGEKEEEDGERMKAMERKLDWLCMTVAPSDS